MDTKLIIPTNIIHKVIILKVGDTYRFKRKKQNEWLPNMVIYHKIIIPTNMNARFKNVVMRVIKDLRIQRYENAKMTSQDINVGIRIRRFKKKIKKIEPPPVEPPPVEPPPVEPPPVEPPPVKRPQGVKIGDRMKLRQMQRNELREMRLEDINRAKEEEEEKDEFCIVQ